MVLLGSAFAAPTTDSTIAGAMLKAHNTVRAKLDLPPLQWSDKLAEVANNWAMTLLMQSAFLHRPHNIYGENMFEIRGGQIEAQEVVKTWADEGGDYDYRLNACRGMCGHYTQIVWRDTRQVGCALARSSVREVWVCNYNPRGNIIGRRPY